MSRTLARRGASVLVAAALLGGGLGLGGGTATAAEASGGSLGSVGDAALGSADWAALVTMVGLQAVGSADPADVWQGCGHCPPAGTPMFLLALVDWVMGNPPGTSMPPPGNLG